MSLNLTLIDPTSTYAVGVLYQGGITHNLNKMAKEAGIYEALWRPYELHIDYNAVFAKKNKKYDLTFENSHIVIAEDITEVIKKGLHNLTDRPQYFESFNSPNGWGLYKHFVPFVTNYLTALNEYPKAIVKVCR